MSVSKTKLTHYQPAAALTIPTIRAATVREATPSGSHLPPARRAPPAARSTTVRVHGHLPPHHGAGAILPPRVPFPGLASFPGASGGPAIRILASAKRVPLLRENPGAVARKNAGN